MKRLHASVRGRLVGIGWFVVCGGPTRALALPAPVEERGVRIESSTCAHALVDEVQHLTRVELNGAGLPEGDDAPRVILTCSEHTILIRAVLGVEADSRQLDLEQTDGALRARVIALASAELVRDTASRTAQPPAAAAKVAAKAPDAAPPGLDVPPATRPPAAASNRLIVYLTLSNFGSSFHPLYGAGFGFAHDFGRVAIGVAPELMVSKRDFALGSVQTIAADLALRVAWRFPSWTLPSEVGVGLAPGLARVRGETDSADVKAASVSGVWAAPFLFGGFEAQLGTPCFLQLAAQLGVVTVPVRGQVARGHDTGVTGAWAGLSLGLGFQL